MCSKCPDLCRFDYPVGDVQPPQLFAVEQGRQGGQEGRLQVGGTA